MSQPDKAIRAAKAERLRRKAEKEQRLKSKSRWILIGTVVCMVGAVGIGQWSEGAAQALAWQEARLADLERAGRRYGSTLLLSAFCVLLLCGWGGWVK